MIRVKPFFIVNFFQNFGTHGLLPVSIISGVRGAVRLPSKEPAPFTHFKISSFLYYLFLKIFFWVSCFTITQYIFLSPVKDGSE